MGPILLTGTTGQVGGELLHTLAPLGTLVIPTRVQLDLADPASVRAAVLDLRPRWIVNPAAYTAVDKAESEPELADAINHRAVQALGESAHEVGAAVLHISTDYVFSGDGTTPYTEADPTGPRSVYGATKLAGEQALAASGAAHLILRTSWVYGANGKNFLRTILKLARERDTLNIVADQHGAPTASRDLARLIAAIVLRCEADAARLKISLPEAVAPFTGIYNATGTGETTWHGFATEAVRQLQERQLPEREANTPFAILHPIATAQYPTPAQRPANSRLSNAKLLRNFHCQMPEWEHSLAAVLDELAALDRPVR